MEKSKQSTFKTRIALGLFKLLGSMPLGMSRFLGAGLGRLMWRLKTREANTTRINIDKCFPELDQQQRDALSKKSVIEFGKTCLEIPVVWQHSNQWNQAKLAKVHNVELIEKALADERGLVLICPHLGNWEAVAGEICLRTPVSAMYEPSRYPEMDEMVKSKRERHGATLVPTNKRGVMALIKTLKTGGTVMVLPDQEPPPASGQFSPFFGVPAMTMTLTSKLLQRTGSQALLMWVVRSKQGFELYYQQPEDQIYSNDETESVAALNRSVENAVRQFPEQYQWEYKRFKYRPEGEEGFYP